MGQTGVTCKNKTILKINSLIEQISSKVRLKYSGSKNASLPILASTLLSNKSNKLKISKSKRYRHND